MTKVRIVAAVVDTQQLTLYKEDGKTIHIPQGDVRLRKIVEEITPILTKRGTATIDLTEENNFHTFEKETKGFARFFRVTKSKVANLFGSENQQNQEDSNPVAPLEVGSIPSIARKISNAVDDIITNAQPVSDPDYRSSDTTEDDTIVAIVGEGDNARAIPGMEKLKDQFAYAAKLGSTIGLQNFLKRIAAVIDERGHNVHELLHFMVRGDLPIADDGSIIIYKVLRKAPKITDPVAQGAGIYYDPHSGKVPQQVGSYVCMDESLIDKNRRTECSTGLHVARRGYLKCYTSDVCVLAKVAPEDVIAVPMGEPDKMRVKGYHILFLLSSEDYANLKNDKPITGNEESKTILGRAIAGDHIGRIEEVRITGRYGDGVKITSLVPTTRSHRDAFSNKGTKKDTPKAVALDDINAPAGAVDPKAVAKEVSAAKERTLSPRQQEADRLRNIVLVGKTNVEKRTAAQQLIAFKKKAKVSWEVLGISQIDLDIILPVSKFPEDLKPTPAPKAAKPKLAKTSPATKKSKASLPKAKAAKVSQKKVKSEANLNIIVAKTGSRQGNARELFKAKDWKGLITLKRKAKVSWEKLGFSAKDIAQITRHTGD